MKVSEATETQPELRDHIRQLTESLQRWVAPGESACVILSGPMDRGRSMLWRSIYRGLGQEHTLPAPIGVDASKPLPRVLDAHRLVAGSKSMETDARDALLVAVQVLLKDSNFAPFSVELLVRLAIAIPAVAKYLGKQAASPPKLDMHATMTWLHDALDLLPEHGPQCLVLENIERTSRGEVVAILPHVAALAQKAAAPKGLMILVTHGMDSDLSHVARQVLREVADIPATQRIALAPLNRRHILDQCGAMSDPLADEILTLCQGSLKSFMAIWRELPASGLIVQDADGAWTYAPPADGGAASSIGAQLMAAVHAQLDDLPHAENAVRALELSALQGNRLTARCVATALWSLGHREDQNRQTHNTQILRLLQQPFASVLEPVGGDGMSAAFTFRSRLLRQQLLRRIEDADHGAEYRLAVAMAIEEHNPIESNEAIWTAINLYGTMDSDVGTAKARHLRIRVQALPSPEGREWEIPAILLYMRDRLDLADWTHWLIDFCWTNRYVYPHDRLGDGLKEALTRLEGGDPELRLQLLLVYARIMTLYCRFDDARGAADQAIALAGSSFGPIQCAEAHQVIATIDIACWRYRDAKVHLVQALADFDGALGDQPPTAAVLALLGLTYTHQGDYERADDLLSRALHIQQNTLGDSPETANTLNFTGLLQHLSGNPAIAETHYAYALTMRQKVLGIHPDTAASLNNMGSLYVDRRDFPRAEEHLRRALAIQVDVLGDHQDTAITLMNLAALYQGESDLDKAEQCGVRALGMLKTLMRDHILTAQSLYLVGGILAAKSMTASAEASLWQAIRMLEAINPLSKEMPLFLRSYAYLLRRMGRAIEADNWEELAVEREAAIAQHALDLDADLG